MKLHHMIFAATLASTAVASETNHQPYNDLEKRDIASLSASDIDALQSGTGWGLALPAELNGYPGPAHVLELATELELSARQKTEVQGIYDAMKVDAVRIGAELIVAETLLDQGFKSDDLTPALLRALINDAEKSRAALRFVHLSRHLETIKLLSEAQILEYARLRGYRSVPCQSVPEGHDAKMWRRHNACDG